MTLGAAFRAAAMLSCICPAEAAGIGTLWLVVASTHRSVLPAIQAAQWLRPVWPEATVAASGDCAAFPEGLYLTVVRAAQSRPEAAADLRKLKSQNFRATISL